MAVYKEGYSGVYLCPDRRAEKRKADKQLRDQLKKRRKSEPGRDLCIKNGRIVSFDRDSAPVVSNDKS